ncbi:dUTP diphosphatase [Alteromonas sp. BMJM2]|uniref:dUTP diphosphatase n=1 Tax=Alteromonas sp. BMJM2 TaxID=2954241 RepID=UPI0022B4C7C6|nr:dUTP diphosphatase [Alteromonas sp. BMJM2]
MTDDVKSDDLNLTGENLVVNTADLKTVFYQPQQDHIKVVKHHPDAALPSMAHPDDAGLDLQTMESVTLPPGKSCVLPSGIAMELPKGYYGRISNRSKIASKLNVAVMARIIDKPFTGELKINLINLGQDTVEFRKGDKVAQIVIERTYSDMPIEEVDSLQETSRGASGIDDAEMRIR